MTEQKPSRKINEKRILPTLFGMPIAEASIAWQLDNLRDLTTYLFQHVIEKADDDLTKDVFSELASASFVDGMAFTRVKGAQVPVKFTSVMGLGDVKRFDESDVEQALEHAAEMLETDFKVSRFGLKLITVGKKFQKQYQQVILPGVQIEVPVEGCYPMLYLASSVENWFTSDDWYKEALKKMN